MYVHLLMNRDALANGKDYSFDRSILIPSILEGTTFN